MGSNLLNLPITLRKGLGAFRLGDLRGVDWHLGSEKIKPLGRQASRSRERGSSLKVKITK